VRSHDRRGGAGLRHPFGPVARRLIDERAIGEVCTIPGTYLADPFPVNRVQGFAEQFRDFVDAIPAGRQPAVTGADRRATVAMVDAAERS
jgi:predicted dehydrogenase